MPKSFGLIKEHWEKGAVVVTVAFEAMIAFEHHLAEVSLATRFLTAGLAGLVATASVAEMLRWEPRNEGVGFSTEAPKPGRPPTWQLICSVIAIVAVTLLSVFLLGETATFHNIRLLQRTDPRDRTVGEIEIQPAHRPANLVISLSTNQSKQIRIVDKAPASWNKLDPVDWRMQNDTAYGVTLFLRDFKSPQVFGCWYRLSATVEGLEVELTPEPAEVRVLRSEQLNRYRRNIWIFGGLVCIASFVFWSYRSSWFRASP